MLKELGGSGLHGGRAQQVWSRQGYDGHSRMELGPFPGLRGKWVGYHPCPQRADTVLQRWQTGGILATVLPCHVHDRHHWSITTPIFNMECQAATPSELPCENRAFCHSCSNRKRRVWGPGIPWTRLSQWVRSKDSTWSAGDTATWVWSLGQDDPLEQGMATRSSILAWEIPWTEEPGGLQSMGSQSQTRLSNYTTSSAVELQEVSFWRICYCKRWFQELAKQRPQDPAS